ncbi:hypothetical protein QH494_05190 [Sphingomonas sp. AR_OL41]|uniref:hypothetical protein n=1 Tax=Sphingomonas sp. AR_OL41 TaxID=3042729 RepID=UPI00247FAC51|nr:hypothetical protein [Sphingomonas sp. AR_OL41]MDH7971568.1 hypothetical protein [Sphingomonas sp. AR_OL41]
MSNPITMAIVAAVALLSATPALASTAQATAPDQGHFEWRAARQAGPRAPIAAPRRAWVGPSSAGDRMASCDHRMSKSGRAAGMPSSQVS